MPKTPPKAPALIAAAVLISAPLTASFEGLRTKPYPDPGNPKVMTVCYGETERPMRTYTAQECAVLLEARQRQDYAPPVLKCVPAIGLRVDAFAASIDAAYNGGAGAFCRSPMARMFNAGQWKAGCNAFPDWHTLPGTRVHKGLVRRREAERQLCLRSA